MWIAYPTSGIAWLIPHGPVDRSSEQSTEQEGFTRLDRADIGIGAFTFTEARSEYRACKRLTYSVEHS